MTTKKKETAGRSAAGQAGAGPGLRARRLASRFSVAALAAAADLPPKSIYDYELGRREPSLTALAALARALACTADSLLAAR